MSFSIHQSNMSFRGRRSSRMFLPPSPDQTVISVKEEPVIDFGNVAVKANDQKFVPIEDMTAKDFYNDKYSHLSFQEDLLKDSVYFESYRHAISYNRHLFKNKVVLDLNCGTGILSMLCAKAGARHVYAIHDSNIAQLAQRVICDNNFSNVITVCQGKIADIELPVKQVDVIITTFFGRSVLYDNELISFIEARDKWLAPNGILLPDRWTLRVAAIGDKSGRYSNNFWNNVYECNMKPLLEVVETKPVVIGVHAKKLMSTSCAIKALDLYKIQKDECSVYSGEFELKTLSENSIEAFVTYFNIEFSKCHIPILLSTAPEAPGTHWLQTVFYLNSHEEFRVEPDEILNGDYHMIVHSSQRQNIDITFNLRFDGKHGTFEQQYNYHMD